MLRNKKRNIPKDRKKSKKIYFQILFYVALLFFLGAFIYVLFFSQMLKVISIEIKGNKNVDKQIILDKINSTISGNYLKYINKDNLLLFKANKTEEEILQQFKIIRKIEIKKIFPNDLVVSMIERIPELIFCSKEKCFIIDENGQAYDERSSLKEENVSNMILLIDESGRNINVGEIILERDYIEYVQGIKKNIFENLSLEIENNFQTPSLISKDIRIRTREGWMVYFNQNINLEKELEMLSLSLNNKIEKEKRIELEYIDLRIENKIYYKFKGGIQNDADLEKNNEEVKGEAMVVEKEIKPSKKKKKK